VSEPPDPIDTAWRIHAANVDWTGKVDSKASFALAIETALMAGVVSLTSDQRRLSDLDGFLVRASFCLGLMALIAALLCVVWVVRPRLRSKSVEAEAPGNFIFFGHAQHWKPTDLAEALPKADMLSMLSRQIVVISKIAWMKHRMLQFSMTFATIGVGLVGIAAWLND
jgi:hypothetical protein